MAAEAPTLALGLPFNPRHLRGVFIRAPFRTFIPSDFTLYKANRSFPRSRLKGPTRGQPGSPLGALEHLKAAEDEAAVAPGRFGDVTQEETSTRFPRRYLEGTSRGATL